MARRGAAPALIGRGAELTHLDAALADASDGRAGTLLVSGEAGIGKSRLIGELVSKARERGFTVATGACAASHGGLPYGPFVAIVRDLARQLGDSVATGLGPLATGFDTGRSEKPSHVSTFNDALAQAVMFGSVLNGLTTLAADTPLLLVVEDAHWADAASIDLLDFLVRNLGTARVLLAVTYRDDEVGRDHPLRTTTTELARLPQVTPLKLAPLAAPDMRDLAVALLGLDADRALVEQVSRRAQGNPFFAEELAAAGSAIPDSLQQLLVARTDALSDDARTVVRVVAAAGGDITHALLEAVTETNDAAIRDAVDQQVLVVDGDGYRFRHALLGEAVYGQLLPGEKQRWHRALAEAVPGDSAEDVALLASQWWAAGAWAEVIAPSLTAARNAMDAFAFRDALVQLEHALAAIEKAGDTSTDRAAVLDRAADVAFMAGRNARAAELSHQAVEAHVAAGNDLAAGRASAVLSVHLFGAIDGEGSAQAMRRALELTEPHPHTAERALTLAFHGATLMVQARFQEAEAIAREALSIARAVGARYEEFHALNTVGACRGFLGHFDEGISLLRESVVLAEELNDPSAVNRAYNNLADGLVTAGRLSEAAAIVFDAAAIGEHLWGARLNGAAGMTCDALMRLGRYDDMNALLAELGDDALGTCDQYAFSLPLPVALHRGELDRARGLLADLDRTTVGLTTMQERGLYFLRAAETALLAGEPATAYDLVEEGLALAIGTDDVYFRAELVFAGMKALVQRLAEVKVSGERFDGEKARLLADQLLDTLASAQAAGAAIGAAPWPMTTCVAELARAERSRLDASDPALWAAAAEANAAIGQRYELAYARLREAEALLEQRQDKGRATASLTEAWEHARAMAVPPLLEEIEQLAQRARIPLTAGEESAAPQVGEDLGLTPRELEVLGQLALGRTDREIADALFISKKTASVHVSNLLRKLDVGSRIAAGKIGREHGLAATA